MLVLVLAAKPANVVAQAPSTPAPPTADFVPNELIVRLTAGAAAATLNALLATIGAVDVKSFETVDGLYVVELPATMSVASARDLARRLDGVAYAEPNYLLYSTTIPSDSSFGDLWGLHNTGQSGGTADADIKAPEAWNITTGSANVVVAVIDTGVDYNHQDLAANMFHNAADCNANGVDDDGNGYIDDCYGIDTANNDSDPMDDNNHGTHVSGTIGAVGNNGVGVVGVNWNVRIMACKFLNASGSGSTSDAIDCLNYVAIMKDRGVNIVATSNSWGGGGSSQAMYDAIDAQRRRGILFIAAAGNSGGDNDTTPNYPSNYDLPNVIAVAATTRTDARSSFSSYGRHTVHLGAPGSAILSTTRNNTYSTFNGTSMATPHVTGVAALLKAQDPSRDWRAIKNLILAGGDNNANLSNTVTGKRLNAYGSLTCTNVIVESRLRPVASSVGVASGQSVTLSALHIDCANPNGNVTVSVSPGNQSVVLADDGVAPDQVAGDGIYAASFVPTARQSTLTFPGGDVVTVDLENASYDSSLKAPKCDTTTRACIAGLTIDGRDNISGGAELHQPNTINGSCVDGTFGVYHRDESVDGLKISTPDGSPLTAGRTANIEARVYVWSSNDDHLDLYYSANETTPSWQYITTLTPSGNGVQVLSANYTLPSGTQQAIRANFRFLGSAAACTSGAYDDHDDLIFTTTTGFTDDPLAAGTAIRAVHITELRSHIDTVRAKYDLAAFPWTDASLGAGTTVKAVHLNELRTALQQAYTAAAQSAPTYTDSTIVPGSTFIKVVHINELRGAVRALEAS